MELVWYVWTGRMPLWKVYWLFGFLGTLFFGAIDGYLAWALQKGTVSVGLVYLVSFLMAAYFVVVCVGTWRSAKVYVGNRVWAVLAQIAAALGIAKTFVLVMTLLGANVR